MTNLTEINSEQDFLSFLRKDAMPNGNLSIRGVARCCGVPHTSIVRAGAFGAKELGQILTGHGFEAGALVAGGFPPQAVWLTIEYFAYDAKSNPPMAKRLARTFGSIGILTTIEKLNQPRFPHLKEQPSPWEKLYDQKFCRTVYGWMGASFYWIFLYQFLTEAERQYLNEVNPAVNGKRKDRIHQYLSQETRDRVEPEVVKLTVLVESSTGLQDFSTRYNRLFGFNQVELPVS